MEDCEYASRDGQSYPGADSTSSDDGAELDVNGRNFDFSGSNTQATTGGKSGGSGFIGVV
jgi:hypothetical protein